MNIQLVRYDLEEFTIVMLQTDKHGVISLIEIIQKKIYDLNTKHEYSEESDRITINFRVSIAYIGIKKDYNDYIIRQIKLYIYLKKKVEMHIHIFNKYNF